MTRNANATTDELRESIMVFYLKRRKPTTRAKVDSKSVRVRAKNVDEDEAQDADEDSLKISKEIIRSSTYKEIAALDRAMGAYVRSQAFPGCSLKLAQGETAIAEGLIGRVDDKVAAMTQERLGLVERLCEEYPAIIEDARTRLGDLFCEHDYPKVEALRAAFDVVTAVSALKVPGARLEQVAPAIFAREQQKFGRQLEAAAAEITDALRVSFYEMVASLTDSLKPGPDGAKKRVMAAGFERLSAFLADFGALNVARDAEVGGLVERAKAILSDPRANVETVRSSQKARTALERNLAEVRSALDGMTTSDGASIRMSYVDADNEPNSDQAAGLSADARAAAERAAERLARVEEELGAEDAAPLAEESGTGARRIARVVAEMSVDEAATSVAEIADRNAESAAQRFAGIE